MKRLCIVAALVSAISVLVWFRNGDQNLDFQQCNIPQGVLVVTNRIPGWIVEGNVGLYRTGSETRVVLCATDPQLNGRIGRDFIYSMDAVGCEMRFTIERFAPGPREDFFSRIQAAEVLDYALSDVRANAFGFNSRVPEENKGDRCFWLQANPNSEMIAFKNFKVVRHYHRMRVQPSS